MVIIKKYILKLLLASLCFQSLSASNSTDDSSPIFMELYYFNKSLLITENTMIELLKIYYEPITEYLKLNQIKLDASNFLHLVIKLAIHYDGHKLDLTKESMVKSHLAIVRAGILEFFNTIENSSIIKVNPRVNHYNMSLKDQDNECIEVTYWIISAPYNGDQNLKDYQGYKALENQRDKIKSLGVKGKTTVFDYYKFIDNKNYNIIDQQYLIQQALADQDFLDNMLFQSVKNLKDEVYLPIFTSPQQIHLVYIEKVNKVINQKLVTKVLANSGILASHHLTSDSNNRQIAELIMPVGYECNLANDSYLRVLAEAKKLWLKNT